MIVLQIDGGIGRVLSATPAIKELAKKDRVVVLTHWAECFASNPDVHRIYHPSHPYLFDDVISGNEFISPEPYFLKEYYDGGIHLADAFAKCLGVTIEDRTPRMYFDEVEIQTGKKMIDELRKAHTDKPIVLFQPFGATQNVELDSDPSGRGMNKAMVNKILDGIDGVFINFSQIATQHPKVVSVNNPSLRLYMILTSLADYCLGIDSCMVHVAAATGRVGSFFWGCTDPKQLGYERFQNIQRQGYPRRHQPMRFAHDNRVNGKAMDWSDDELEQAIEAVKAHLAKCLGK